MNNNTVYHPNRVPKEKKNLKNNHGSPVIWITGLSGSGKSTLGNALEQTLFDRDVKTQILDGDNVRQGLNKDLGFSDDDRKENMRRISEVAKLVSDSGSIAIASFISPFEDERQACKEIIGAENFIEVYLNTDLSVCEDRDPKGLYKKARAGEIPMFTGIDSPYEAPINADLVIDTNKTPLRFCVAKIIMLLQDRGLIPFAVEEVDNLDKKKTVSIDFDGVIHKYSKGFQGLDNAYDPPMEGALESLQVLYDGGYILKILSSRPKEVIYPWLKKYGVDHLITEVSNHKFPATIYIDDRGYHFKDWESTMVEIKEHPKMSK